MHLADSVNITSTSSDSNPTSTILTSVEIYLPILTAGFLLFEYLRHHPKFQLAYFHRKFSEYYSLCPTLDRRFRFLEWIPAVYTLSDEQVLAFSGLDNLLYLRFMRLGQKIALCGIILSAALFPIYATGGSDASGTTDNLKKITLSYVSSNSWRLWISTIALCIICSFSMYLILREYRIYVTLRHQYLSKRDTPQYSVVISNLPKKLRTAQTLRKYLEDIFPDQILYVYVNVECKELEDLVDEREKVRNKLEHLLAKAAIDGERPMMKSKETGGQIDEIEFHEDKLKELNKKVEKEADDIFEKQHRFANKIQDSMHEAPFVADIAESGEGGNGVNDEEEGEEKDENLTEDQKKEKNIMRSSAFVIFNRLRASQISLQTLQSSKPIEMRITPAPKLEDIVWSNVGLDYRVQQIAILVSISASVAIILFWTIPTVFVAGLANASTLKDALPFLENWSEKYSWVDSLLEQLAPIGLAIMSALAPIIFKILSKREGHQSLTAVDASLFGKLVGYEVVQTFLVPVIGGSLLQQVQILAENPSEVVDVLGQTLPNQSTLYITYVIVKMGVGLPLELLQVVPIAINAVYRLFAPKLTERERNSKWLGLTPLTVGKDFDQASKLAQYVLIVIITLVFCPIAPLVCYFCGFYFFLSDVVYRRSLLYFYDPNFASSGVYWPSLYIALMIAIVISELTFIGLLGLKEAQGPFVLIVILFVCTILFHYSIYGLYQRISKNLPLVEANGVDQKRSNMEDLSKDLLKEKYAQPALQQRDPIYPVHEEFEAISSNVGSKEERQENAFHL